MSTEEKIPAEETEEKVEAEVETEAAEEAVEEKTEEAEVVEVTVSPEMAALTDKYLRICAEYDNFRKRSQREKSALYSDVKAESVKQFLPVYDNLARALAQPTADEAYAKGVEMIMNQFKTTLEKLGVTKIDSLGKSFDPNLHNAVMHIDDESFGENEIVEVFQEGFMIGDKVIRFAMVKVAN